MMDEIGFKVDEIVTTRDTAVRYVCIHLKKRARLEDLNRAIQTLASRGVKGSEIFGYGSVDGNTPSESEHLEDHPGFQTLVEHERVRGSEFHRWTASNINPLADFGYNRLRHKLLAKRSSDSATGGGDLQLQAHQPVKRPGVLVQTITMPSTGKRKLYLHILTGDHHREAKMGESADEV